MFNDLALGIRLDLVAGVWAVQMDGFLGVAIVKLDPAAAAFQLPQSQSLQYAAQLVSGQGCVWVEQLGEQLGLSGHGIILLFATNYSCVFRKNKCCSYHPLMATPKRPKNPAASGWVHSGLNIM